jgi:hypothetical protein
VVVEAEAAVPEPPSPPDEWLAEHTGPGSKASAGFGWQAGWRAGWVDGHEAKPVRKRAGKLELAVRRDLRDIGDLPSGGHALAEIAAIIARAIDAEEGPLTARAKLAQELRVTLGQLREVARDGFAGDEDGEPSTPVWHAAESGASDVGAAGR